MRPEDVTIQVVLNEAIKLDEKDLKSMMGKFQIDPIMNVDTFVKANDCPRITNPIMFDGPGVPTSDGLLSNELFGTTASSRANTFGYIELNGLFLHPLAYKVWSRMDKTISEIVWSDNTYSVNKSGDIVKDENGESGIEFLKNNFDKIKIKSTGSLKRDTNIELLKRHKDDIFITKLIVSPPYIRDVLVSKGKTEVGELNQMYQKVLINANSLESLAQYGIVSTDYLTRGRIQEEILNIYNWFIKEPNLGQKRSITRRAVLGKTTDYASRMVMTAPELNVESPDDLVTTLDYATIPLPSLCANVKPFLIFWLRNRFQGFFSGTGYLINQFEGNKRIHIEDFEEQFNDERFNKEISRFIKGYSNRFVPITGVDEKGKEIPLMYFNYNGIRRRATWCDLFYIACEEICGTNKHVLITRYPIDSYFSQFPCKIRPISTTETEKITINGKEYPNYPKIREEDIGKDTSSKFRDSVNIFNTYLPAIVGDYDGDQVGISAIFSDEANEEIAKYQNSKSNYVDMGVSAVRKSSNEAIQSMYSLTLVLSDDKPKLTSPVF